MATKKKSATVDKPKDFTCHKNVLTVDKNVEKMSQEAKDFVDDVNHITKTCPFCGKKPIKDVIEFGASEVGVKKIMAEEEYQLDPDYRKIMNDYIQTNTKRMECRISCINEECIQPSTGFQETIEETETKWNTRF